MANIYKQMANVYNHMAMTTSPCGYGNEACASHVLMDNVCLHMLMSHVYIVYIC